MQLESYEVIGETVELEACRIRITPVKKHYNLINMNPVRGYIIKPPLQTSYFIPYNLVQELVKLEANNDR